METIAKATNITPSCHSAAPPMTIRTAHRGPNAGSTFYGCTQFPKTGCHGTRPALGQ